MDDIRIFTSETIPQYKIIEHILREYGELDERIFTRTNRLYNINRNTIKLVDEKGNTYIYTYNEETKEIKKEDQK